MTQDPGDILDYIVNWSAALESSEILLSSSFEGGGLTATSPSFTPTTTTVFLSGGAHGSGYQVVNTVTTSATRTFVRRFTLQIERL